jgi:hypothetical protein
MKKSFIITQLINPISRDKLNNGFQITFENGHTVSVQFGKVNYCDEGITTAEVAAWGDDGEWIQLSEHDNVKGHCSPNEVLEIMNRISQL